MLDQKDKTFVYKILRILYRKSRGETQSLEQKKINLFIYNNNGQEINLW